jgi:hypothetical protein
MARWGKGRCVARGIFTITCGVVVPVLTYAVNRRGVPAVFGGERGAGLFRATWTTCGLACVALGVVLLLRA